MEKITADFDIWHENFHSSDTYWLLWSLQMHWRTVAVSSRSLFSWHRYGSVDLWVQEQVWLHPSCRSPLVSRSVSVTTEQTSLTHEDHVVWKLRTKLEDGPWVGSILCIITHLFIHLFLIYLDFLLTHLRRWHSTESQKCHHKTNPKKCVAFIPLLLSQSFRDILWLSCDSIPETWEINCTLCRHIRTLITDKL